MNFNKIIRCVLVLVFFFAGLFLGWLFFTERCDKSLYFLNEEARCSEKSYVINKKEYTVTKQLINDYLISEQDNHRLIRFSVYFRDLEDGPIFGINEKEAFVPASLLKLPLMLTYFRLAETNPDILKTKVKFSSDNIPKLNYNYQPTFSAKENTEYTIDDLIYFMIVNSDNNSAFVLIKYLEDIDSEGQEYLETYKNLGMINPDGNLSETIYTKSYSSIFRNLYNSSYLSNKYSQKALSYLSKSDFKEGLVHDLPPDIVVAHKFGERSGLSNDQKELHDCGIVYYPRNPYLLCVMVEGYNFEHMSDVIKKVSKIVYDEVDSRRI
jgi:beta-lactamase class A